MMPLRSRMSVVTTSFVGVARSATSMSTEGLRITPTVRAPPARAARSHRAHARDLRTAADQGVPTPGKLGTHFLSQRRYFLSTF